MAISIAPLIINIADPEKNGAIANFSSVQPAARGLEIKGDSSWRSIFLVEPSTTAGLVWDPVEEDAAKFRLGIGPGDIPPTGGEWSLLVGATSVGPFDFDAADATVQAALDAEISGVAVKKLSTGNYTITWPAVGAQDLLGGDPGTLTPESNVAASQLEEGDAETAEVQLIQIAQRPYVYCETFTDTTATSGDQTFAGVKGKLRLNSAALAQKFAELGADSFTTTVQIRLDDGPDDRTTVYFGTTTLFREVLSVAGLSPSGVPTFPTFADVLAIFPQNKFALTGLVGGTTDDLDGQPTADQPAGQSFRTFIGGVLREHLLTTDTTAATTPPDYGVIWPTDHDPVTNPKIYVQIG